MLRKLRLATHGWIGLALVAVFWPANWLLPGLRTHLLFGPLWIGYALAVDSFVLARTQTSIFARSRRDFLVLFLLSAPAWWLFELFNRWTENWVYVGREEFSDLAYFVLASLSFSTVMPAVFGSAELVASTKFAARFAGGPAIRPTNRLRITLLLIGAVSLALVWKWPTYAYPLIWGVVFFLLEPVNQWLGRPSLFDDLRDGDWRRAISLGLGTLLCGFFWEFWNFWSFPKWTYNTAGVDFWHIFEMPAVGYIGYLPFGLELYVIAAFVLGRSMVPLPPRSP